MFNDVIPENLKYEGYVYRVLFFNNNEDYERAWNMPIKMTKSIIRATKNYDALPKIIDN